MSSVRLVDDTGVTQITLDTDPILTTLDLGYPTVRESTVNSSGMDGEDDLTQYTGGRAIVAEVAFASDSALQQMDAVRGLMHPGRRYWLHVLRDGWAAERRIRVRGATLSMSGTIPWTGQLGWKAPGATFQAVTASSVTLNPAGQSTGGMAFPVTLPMSFQPGLVPGASVVSVGGTANAYPTIDIYGPCTGPLFRVVDTGATLSFPNLSIAQGDYLHIDTSARTITLNNDPAQSQYAQLDFGASTWPTLPYGNPQVVFSPQSASSGCVAVVSWRSQWL